MWSGEPSVERREWDNGVGSSEQGVGSRHKGVGSMEQGEG